LRTSGEYDPDSCRKSIVESLHGPLHHSEPICLPAQTMKFDLQLEYIMHLLNLPLTLKLHSGQADVLVCPMAALSKNTYRPSLGSLQEQHLKL